MWDTRCDGDEFRTGAMLDVMVKQGLDRPLEGEEWRFFFESTRHGLVKSSFCGLAISMSML